MVKTQSRSWDAPNLNHKLYQWLTHSQRGYSSKVIGVNFPEFVHKLEDGRVLLRRRGIEYIAGVDSDSVDKKSNFRLNIWNLGVHEKKFEPVTVRAFLSSETAYGSRAEIVSVGDELVARIKESIKKKYGSASAGESKKYEDIFGRAMPDVSLVNTNLYGGEHHAVLVSTPIVKVPFGLSGGLSENLFLYLERYILTPSSLAVAKISRGNSAKAVI